MSHVAAGPALRCRRQRLLRMSVSEPPRHLLIPFVLHPAGSGLARSRWMMVSLSRPGRRQRQYVRPTRASPVRRIQFLRMVLVLLAQLTGISWQPTEG